jgi:hypothetical protein
MRECEEPGELGAGVPIAESLQRALQALGDGARQREAALSAHHAPPAARRDPHIALLLEGRGHTFPLQSRGECGSVDKPIARPETGLPTPSVVWEGRDIEIAFPPFGDRAFDVPPSEAFVFSGYCDRGLIILPAGIAS